MADETKLGSFRIQKMTQPDTDWIWSLSNESDEYVMSKGGYKSAEDAVRVNWRRNLKFVACEVRRI